MCASWVNLYERKPGRRGRLDAWRTGKTQRSRNWRVWKTVETPLALSSQIRIVVVAPLIKPNTAGDRPITLT